MTNILTTLTAATKLLRNTSESAALDAEVLLSFVLDKPRSHLKAWPEKRLQIPQYNQFQTLLKQRHQGLPIAYLTGNREFWSRDFKVNKDVLIPRPDTELLIELGLKLINNISKPRILDLGTGSGIIAITLAAERPDSHVLASDISELALALAKQNAASYQLQNIQFIKASWLHGIQSKDFDFIISNPPYIDSNDPHLSQGDLRFEPKSALVAADKGLKDIKTIISQSISFLKNGATLLIEHGFDQHLSVQEIYKSFAYKNIKTHTDLSNNPRVTTAQWKA